MARKAKPDTVKQDQQPAKSPEEIFSDHYPAILLAKVESEKKDDEARKVRGVFRAALKAFKKSGGNVDALTAALAVRNRDPDEVTREWRDINRYARLMNLPIGAQLGLFEDGQTVGAKVDAAKIDGDKQPVRGDKTLTACKKEGAKASAAGKFATDNPYEEGSPQFLAWIGAYNDAQAAAVHAMGKSHGNGAHAGA